MKELYISLSFLKAIRYTFYKIIIYSDFLFLQITNTKTMGKYTIN